MSTSRNNPIPLIDVRAQNEHIEEQLVDLLRRTITNSDYGTGPAVEEFEQQLAEFTGTREAVGVASGTAALDLLLRGLGVGRGDEVVLPANTFFATAESVISAGAEPILVDPDLATANASADAVAAAITPRTAAIIGVHLYGQPVDVPAYRALADRHGLAFVEDAAQAIGAETDDGRAGSFGRAAGFSFYPAKNLGALGQAGAVTTDDRQLASAVRSLRSHGEATRYTHEAMGLNERLDGLQAAFLSLKLPFVEKWQAQRSAAVARYDERVARIPGCTRIEVRREVRSAHHLYVVRVPHRDALLTHLRDDGVGAAVHYPIPIHRQPAWARMPVPGPLPNAEQLAGEVISLPLYPEITTEQIDYCVDALGEAIDRHGATPEGRSR